MEDSDVEAAVLNRFQKILPSSLADGEFTVLAAIVACRESTCKVLSLGTGTKCCGDGRQESLAALTMEGNIVKDSHAEVLARRAFISYLVSSLGALLHAPQNLGLEQEDDTELIFEWKERENKVGLKKGYSLALYISDSPCGDASIYRRRVDGQEVEFTGAKRARVDKNNEGDTDKREPHKQTLGVLRTKSGRSDLPEKQRSTSMSCSDKICRWMHLGLQGSLLAPFVEPLYLNRIIVGKDPLALDEAQYAALERALLSRCSGLARYPHLAIPDNTGGFSMGKCNVQHTLLNRKKEVREKKEQEEIRAGEGLRSLQGVRKRKQGLEGPLRKSKARPSGSSINWICDMPFYPGASKSDGSKGQGRGKLRVVAGGSLEVTQAQAGILQGASKDLEGSLKASSRLCRRKIAAQLAALLLQPEAQGILVMPPLRGKVTNAPQLSSCGPPIEGEAQSVEVKAAHLNYGWWKCADDDYGRKRTAFLSTASFRDWLVAPSGPEWSINEIL